MNKKAVIVGATSSLGVALCRLLAMRGKDLLLVGRNAEMLEALATDLRVRGNVSVEVLTFDLLVDKVTPQWFGKWGTFSQLFMLAGDMGNGETEDVKNIQDVAYVNFVVPSQICALAAADMAAQGGGEIAIVTSVAGDRGRGSNYVYGSAKAGMTAFASGLRNRYAARKVHVMTAKPGFIDTPMTFGMDSPLIATREKVAEGLLAALAKKRNIAYLPWFWKYIMLIIQHIPEFIFKKLKL